MCGENQALNLESGVIAGMSQLWFFMEPLSIKGRWFPLPCLFFLEYSFIKTYLIPFRLKLITVKTTAYQCRFPDTLASSDSSECSGCQQSLSFACETPAYVYFHLQGQQTQHKVPDANTNTANMFSHGTSTIPSGPGQINKIADSDFKTFPEAKAYTLRKDVCGHISKLFVLVRTTHTC